MPISTFMRALRNFGGVGANRTGHLEKWVSGAGGLAGMLGVLLVSQTYLGLHDGVALVASMGASAVLLFAVPHGPLSQPWAVLGGHLISAVIGVTCTRLGLDFIAAAALAVALSISAMYYLRCIHPPGGATALTAVAGGESVQALGYHFVLTPVLLNVLIILSVAFLFNLAFPWRRYPAAWARKPETPAPAEKNTPVDQTFSRGALTAAASTFDSTPGFKDNLETICTLALCNTAKTGHLQAADIHRDSYYCNGAFGPDWQVRQVVEFRTSPNSESNMEEQLIYRVVAGDQRRQTAITSREAFADWAHYEVCRNENSWQRVDTAPCLAVADYAA